jgi:integrase/recombinase XerD
MRLRTAAGARKYLTAGERDAFLRQAALADREVRTLCMTLAHAGCRLSKALALTAKRVDLAAGVLVFESLKKRRSGIYRSVPVPRACLRPSTWSTASASCRPAAARGAGSASGPGRE